MPDWLARAETSGIAMLVARARTLRKHALGLLAYCDEPISTDPWEGANTESFHRKIMACREAKYA